MKEFVITTDNTADMPYDFYEKNDIEYMYLPYMMENVTYDKGTELPVKEFYSRMRAGSMPTTSHMNAEAAKEAWLPYLKQGKEILHLAFSSGLSGSCNNCMLAANDLIEEHPEYRIVVIDTLCASMGEGLLVYKAVQMKKEGKSLDEIAGWVNAHIQNFCHVFTVDDLNHLYRGGRVSKATAVLGSMINIKPILHVDEEGHLVPIEKVRGRKRSLSTLVELMDKRLGSYRGKNDVIFISHGDCEEDALYVAGIIKEKYGIDNFMINHIGATIGTHAGPGTVALFFLGDFR